MATKQKQGCPSLVLRFREGEQQLVECGETTYCEFHDWVDPDVDRDWDEVTA